MLDHKVLLGVVENVAHELTMVPKDLVDDEDFEANPDFRDIRVKEAIVVIQVIKAAKESFAPFLFLQRKAKPANRFGKANLQCFQKDVKVVQVNKVQMEKKAYVVLKVSLVIKAIKAQWETLGKQDKKDPMERKVLMVQLVNVDKTAIQAEKVHQEKEVVEGSLDLQV